MRMYKMEDFNKCSGTVYVGSLTYILWVILWMLAIIPSIVFIVPVYLLFKVTSEISSIKRGRI